MEHKIDQYTIMECINAIRQKYQYQKDKMYEYGQKLSKDPTSDALRDMFELFKSRVDGLEIALDTLYNLEG